MRAGPIDRRIDIQAATITKNDHHEEIATWSTVRTVRAQKIDDRGQERFSAPRFVGKQACVFKIRWSDAVKIVTTLHRVVFDGRAHDIVGVRELGRREGIEIECTVRSEDPVSP